MAEINEVRRWRWKWLEHILRRAEGMKDCLTTLGWTLEGRRVRKIKIKNYLEKTCWERAKQGGLEELGSSQSDGTAVMRWRGERDDLMPRLLAEGDYMMMLMILISEYDQSTENNFKLL